MVKVALNLAESCTLLTVKRMNFTFEAKIGTWLAYIYT